MHYVPLILGFIAMAAAVLSASRTTRLLSVFLGLAAVVSAGMIWFRPLDDVVENLLLLLFSAVAMGSAGAMVGSRNPVYAALWFALVTLCVCALFVLQSAPFLAAATTIIYAGAIIVTFLFVIMLARQAAHSSYDQHSNQPLAATCIAVVILGALLVYMGDQRVAMASRQPIENMAPLLSGPEIVDANLLSQPTDRADLGNLRGLGRSLFGDYLYPVELAGTLLLVAAIAAIAIAPKRQGALR